MSYRVTNRHIECALEYLNDRLGKKDGELGCIRTYNNNVVQLVTEGGGIRVLAYTSTKREAYDTIQAFIDFHRYNAGGASMRKIEREMLEAVNNGNNWSLANTEVVSDGEGLTWVYLHGNLIALSVDGIIEPMLDTLSNWPTVTTKSRLRALGVDLTQTKGRIFIDGEFICEVKNND